MVEVNVDRLRDLAGQIRSAVRELEEIGRLGKETFLRDRRVVNSAKYLLIVAAEAVLDICNHLVARKGGRSPRDYADCVEILGESPRPPLLEGCYLTSIARYLKAEL